MPTKLILTASLIAGVAVGGCSTTPSLPSSLIATNSIPSTQNTAEKANRPVVAARPTRMYVWAGFMEKDCSAAVPTITVSQQPAKGELSLKQNEPTFIQHSTSGKCLGKSLPGTGIYYTARKGQEGADQFTLTATSPTGQVATRSFKVNIIE